MIEDQNSKLLPQYVLAPLDYEDERQTQSTVSTMRKYKQLFLFVVAVSSFIGFIFYKHEYDRLYYTLEYLEVFGEPPKSGERFPSQCSFALQERSSTPPAEWTTISRDVAVYSTFWDEDNGLVQPKLRTIALEQKNSNPPANLNVQLYYENGVSVGASCEMENTETRKHVFGDSKEFHIVFIVCTPNIPKEHAALQSVAPNLVQFIGESGRWSEYKPVHESNGFKTVEDRSAVCVLPSKTTASTVNIIEFISFYHILGFNKFVFYGNSLTSATRNLLNKYVDEMGIIVEEKSYNYIPSLQELHNNSTADNIAHLDYITRQVIELDCQYRHRDSYENVVTLESNEFIIPTQRDTIASLLKSFSILGKKMKQVSEFHFSTQDVCVDPVHQKSNSKSLLLLLGRQLRSESGLSERGVAVLRPHILTTSLGRASPAGGIQGQQHVSPASAVVYKFVSQCGKEENHEDIVHLPTRTNYVSLIESSLLFRKWKVIYEGSYSNMF